MPESPANGARRELDNRPSPGPPGPGLVSARLLAADVKTQIRRLGGNFMKSAQARGDAAALGLADLPYYFAGRGGVLGDIDEDAAATLFHFFPAELARASWQSARERMPPLDIAQRYAATCRAWGRERLGDWPPAARLAELLELVADAASAAGLPLFAAWRSVPLPADGPGRATQLAHVLREHRGGHHAIAVLASGLDPLLAVLARDDGATRARQLHWAEPFPPLTDEIRVRRRAIEELTDDLAAPPYTVLDDAEAEELKILLGQAYRLAVPHAGPA